LGEIIGRKIEINEAQLTSSLARNEFSVISNSKSLRISIAKEINDSIKSFYTQNTNQEERNVNRKHHTPRSVKNINQKYNNDTIAYEHTGHDNILPEKYKYHNNLHEGVLELEEEAESVEMRSKKDRRESRDLMDDSPGHGPTK
jgi:hypothetical protein